MKIVSWNVNSVKARLAHVKRYLAEEKPDVLMLQELKGLEFPQEEFSAAGYNARAVVQKAYNGVAILSKHPLDIVLEKLPGDEADEQARYLEANINGVRVINIYLPNGNPVFSESEALQKHPRENGDQGADNGSPLMRGCLSYDKQYTEKYDYKLRWMKRLYVRLHELVVQDIPFIIGGDFNIIPEEKDAKNPKDWEQDALFRIESHQAFRALLNLGLYDAFRMKNSASGQYTFWDYQAGAWQKDNGIRIDHFLLSGYYADRLENCRINKTPRGWDSASDHTPIEIDLNIGA